MNYKDKFVGIKIYGFCGGCFGRDSYEDKIIIASGENWIVAKNDSGLNEFYLFDDESHMEPALKEWAETNDD